MKDNIRPTMFCMAYKLSLSLVSTYSRVTNITTFLPQVLTWGWQHLHFCENDYTLRSSFDDNMI